MMRVRLNLYEQPAVVTATRQESSAYVEVSIPRHSGRVWFDPAGDVVLVRTVRGSSGAGRRIWDRGSGKEMSTLAACLVRAAITKRRAAT
jgi:hypothetical protein